MKFIKIDYLDGSQIVVPADEVRMLSGGGKYSVIVTTVLMVQDGVTMYLKTYDSDYSVSLEVYSRIIKELMSGNEWNRP